MNTSNETTVESNLAPISLQPPRPSTGTRWLSLGEFVVASAIVIGHNVYHRLPNEVPILFVMALISFRVRDGGWRRLGLRWPDSWRRTVLIALVAAALRILLGALVVEPVTAHFWPPAVAPGGMAKIPGHITQALEWFLLVWTFRCVWRRDWISGLPDQPCRRFRRAVESGFLGWDGFGIGALRLWTLLQGSIGNHRFRHGWSDSGSGVSIVRTELMRMRFSPRFYRYHWTDCRLPGMVMIHPAFLANGLHTQCARIFSLTMTLD